MKTLSRIILTISLAVSAALSIHAEAPEDMTLADNIAFPSVPQKASNPIIRHMERIGKTFARHNLEVKYMRKGEVVEIIVPSDNLFAPNETTLLPEAAKVLSAFSAIVKLPSLYKILIVAHTDDAGSPEYSETLSESRANAVDDYLSHLIANPENANIVPYGMGLEEPRVANTSIAGRASNRRIEILIVPESQTIEMARANKL